MLRPNLVADPPVAHGGPEEGEWNGAKRLLLRFDGYIRNQGPGRLEVRGRRASPSEPMHVYQRLYREGAAEVHGEQPPFEYEEVPDPRAQLVYDTEDGHDHFHLEEVAHYSLWSLDRSREVAPAQKAGFCLTDSEHVEAGVGPEEAFYHDESERHFCEYMHPEALSVWEGISVGWRDTYAWDVALQWVDLSDVAPGEYWLREDVDPKGLLTEAGTPGEAAKHAWSQQPVTVPGFDAVGRSLSDPSDAPVTVTLVAQRFGVTHDPGYAIAVPPRHGTLGPLRGDRVTYTPQPGAGGTDSFTYYAFDPASRFPATPVQATVTLALGTPSVAITSAPASMLVGATALLSATSSEFEGAVGWSASAGTITPGGLFTAPAMPGPVTVAASAGPAVAERTILVEPLTPPPLLGPGDLRAVRHGRWLVLTARAGHSGLLRLDAFGSGRRPFASCGGRVREGELFRCRVRLRGRAAAPARLTLRATLRFGRVALRAQLVLPMRSSSRR